MKRQIRFVDVHKIGNRIIFYFLEFPAFTSFFNFSGLFSVSSLSRGFERMLTTGTLPIPIKMAWFIRRQKTKALPRSTPYTGCLTKMSITSRKTLIKPTKFINIADFPLGTGGGANNYGRKIHRYSQKLFRETGANRLRSSEGT